MDLCQSEKEICELSMRVVQQTQLTGDIFALELEGAFPVHGVEAGQFVMVQIGSGVTHVLRRPLSIAEVALSDDGERGRLTLVYRVVGQGTDWLKTLSRGESVGVLGPLGTGFPIWGLGRGGSGKVLIVGGGVGTPPLFELTKRLHALGHGIQVRLGFKDKDDVFWADRFAQFGNVQVFTQDGSWGQAGVPTDGLADALDNGWRAWYACGPIPLLQALAAVFTGTSTPGFVSLEERMACGIGACMGCALETDTPEGYSRVCVDGPVFDYRQILWTGGESR